MSVTKGGTLPRPGGIARGVNRRADYVDLLESIGDRVCSPRWQATLSDRSVYGRKLNGDEAATERELRHRRWAEISPQADSTPNRS